LLDRDWPVQRLQTRVWARVLRGFYADEYADESDRQFDGEYGD